MATKAMIAQTEKLMDEINKEFGEGAANYAKDMKPIVPVTTGSLALDFAIGIGGIPKSRVVEICGKEGSGKTTLALLIISQLLDSEPNRFALFIDMEHKLTPAWVEKLIGAERMQRLVVLNPEHIEQATEMYRRALRKGIFCATILDSIGGAPTSQVMDEDRSAEKADSMGGNAKGVTKFARFAANLSDRYDCLTIGINQTRDDLQSMHGNMLNTPGGRGWKHACVLRIELKRGKEKYFQKINDEDVQVGYDVIARVFKNQLAVEGRTAQWRFFNQDSNLAPLGIDTTEECVRLSTKVGVVERNGGWYSHGTFPENKSGEHKVNGLAAVNKLVTEDAGVRAQLVSEVLAALRTDPEKLALVAPLTDLDSDFEGQSTLGDGQESAQP